MRRLLLTIVVSLLCSSAMAQTYWAHVGDNMNTGATTSKIWCSVVPEVTGRGSITIGTDGVVQATDPDAFSGMVVEAVHASNVYRRTGLYYFPQTTPTIRELRTVTAKTDNDTITTTEGNRSPMTAGASSSWGYWVTTCQRLLTASDPLQDDAMFGILAAGPPGNVGLQNILFTTFNLYYTPGASQAYTYSIYKKHPPGYLYPSALTSSTHDSALSTIRAVKTWNFAGTSVLVPWSEPLALSVAIRTETTDQYRPIMRFVPWYRPGE